MLGKICMMNRRYCIVELLSLTGTTITTTVIEDEVHFIIYQITSISPQRQQREVVSWFHTLPKTANNKFDSTFLEKLR